MFSQRLKQLRKINDLTQKDLADELEVTAGAVALWETGKRTPDFETIIKIASFFKVTTDYLLNEDSENEIIIIGSNGDFKRFTLDEKNLKVIESLAQSLTDKR